jgi:hypothetical protein
MFALAQELQNALVRHIFLGEEPFFVLRVRRSHLLDDTVMNLRRVNPSAFKKPLKVRVYSVHSLHFPCKMTLM